MIKHFPVIFISGVIIFSNLVSSAHYITGQVEDALDSTSPNGRTVILWNPANGISDNLTDIVGPTGNSGVSNIYLIDCELLNTSCQINDQLNITLIDDASGYTSKGSVQVTVTGAGFDIAPNISMNTPPKIANWTVDDIFSSPANEIDLTPASNTTVFCSGIVTEYDGMSSLVNYTSEFYASSSFIGDADDNNHHYTNSSCFLNTSYGGSNEAEINCTYEVEYYANSESWQCMVNLTDNSSVSANYSDSTIINSLLALGANSTASFGTVPTGEVSNETLIEVINYGNVNINLSLSGYGTTEGDGNSMECDFGNISIYEMKYNLTSSNPGNLTLSQVNQYYKNLSSSPVNEELNLSFRKNDTTNNAKNNTYWRIYASASVEGQCQGNIVLGATQG